MLRFLVFLLLSNGRAETWKIVTLDWPPYTNEHAPEEGAAAVAFREAMKSVGIDIEYIYMPWSRGTYEVRKADYAGLFPVWKNESFRGGKNSVALFSSPIGFVQNKKNIHPWKSPKDFKGLDIGIVENYGYPTELLSLGKKGVYHLKPVASDEQNLRMVSFGRIDLTVVDLINARYLAEIRYPELQGKLYYDPVVYEKAELFMSIRDDAKFQFRAEKIKAALKKFPLQKRIDELLRQIFLKTSQAETKPLPIPTKRP
jgi:polar amino acid transport system substrate-binding protein